MFNVFKILNLARTHPYTDLARNFILDLKRRLSVSVVGSLKKPEKRSQRSLNLRGLNLTTDSCILSRPRHFIKLLQKYIAINNDKYCLNGDPSQLSARIFQVLINCE